MSLKKILFKNTIFNLLGYFYLLLVSFVSISLFLQNLGRELFGIYLFLASFVPIASVFDFGVSLATIRELSLPQNSHQEKIKTWQTALAIFISQGLLLLVVFAGLLVYLFSSLPLLRGLSPTNVMPTIVLVSLTILINHVNNIFLSIPQAYQRFDIFNSKTFLVGTANTILSALLTFYTHNLSHLFLLQFIFHLVTFIFILFYAKSIFGWSYLEPRFDKATGKSLLSYGLKNFIGTLFNQIEAQASKFFLGFLSTAQSITAFSIPQNIIMKGAGIVSQFAQAFFPLSTSLLEKDRILKLKKLYLGLQYLIFSGGIVAVITTFYFGEPFLSWWLHDPVVVNAAYPVLQIMSFYFVLIALTPLPTALVQGLGKPQVASFFAVLTTVLEISSMAILIPLYKEMGAAYSLLASLIITVPSFLLVTWIMLRNQIKRTQSLA